MTRWMIYGANGYTGELIAREAVKRGLRPVLAGRGQSQVEALAHELGLESRVFSLTDPEEVARQLAGHALILHCAGPFSVTARPMMEGCLRARAHYLDITGEISVFEFARSLHESAREVGVVICPGVGFDVIPTDCVAAALKEALPDATHLTLGFDTSSAPSPGTAKTLVEGLGQGGKIRKNKEIITVPLAYRVRTIDFGNGSKPAITIPWGDVSTAYQTTEIPNIEVFIPMSHGLIFIFRVANYLKPLLTSSWLKTGLKALISKFLRGPSEENRGNIPTYVWGEVKNARGETKVARVRTDNVYSLTVNGALAVVEYLGRRQPEGGSYTPSRLVDYKLVTRLLNSSEMAVT